MGEDDDQDPNDLRIALVGFFHRAVDQRPNPKDCQRQTQAAQKNKEKFKPTEHRNEYKVLDSVNRNDPPHILAQIFHPAKTTKERGQLVRALIQDRADKLSDKLSALRSVTSDGRGNVPSPD